jgi:hypothetical protein
MKIKIIKELEFAFPLLSLSSLICNMSDFLSRQAKKERKEREYFSRILAGSNKGKARASPYPKESPRRRTQTTEGVEGSTAQGAGTISEPLVIPDENTQTVAGSTETTQMTGSSQSQPSSLGKRKRDDEGI